MSSRLIFIACSEVVYPYYEKLIPGKLGLGLGSIMMMIIMITLTLTLHLILTLTLPPTLTLTVGEGMPLSKNPATRGDLIIKFHILFPKYLNGTKRVEIKKLLGNEDLQT
jgi:hypothetical protein